MNSNMILRIVVIGIGATLIVDFWGFIQSLFKIKSLDYRYVGRWIANFSKGKFYHKNIMKTLPVRSELLIGWTAHYLIGITFSFLLILVYGKEWLEKPLYYPAVFIGIITVIAPFIIMQPALGFGIASSKLPEPNLRRFKSLLTHLIFGIGLYLSAILLNKMQ